MHLLPHNHTWWIVFTPRPTPGGSYSHKFHTWRVVFTQKHVGCAEIPLAFWICDPPWVQVVARIRRSKAVHTTYYSFLADPSHLCGSPPPLLSHLGRWRRWSLHTLRWPCSPTAPAGSGGRGRSIDHWQGCVSAHCVMRPASLSSKP